MNQQFKKLLPLLLALSSLLTSSSPTLAQSLEEQSVLTALALNIVRFTTWPAEAQLKDNIDFCVVGDNVVQQSFTGIDHKSVGNKTLRVINLLRLRNFEQCHALYISDLKQAILLQLFVEIKKRPVLTIGENYEFAKQGGMIGMENVNGKITLHINLPMVRESNLNISSRLLNLAKIIGN